MLKAYYYTSLINVAQYIEIPWQSKVVNLRLSSDIFYWLIQVKTLKIMV